MLTLQSVRPTREDELHIKPYVTSSMIEAVVTCPKYGIIYNVQRKRFVTGYRQMALDAGSLMHEVFSIFNLFQVAQNQGLFDHAMYHGEQLFPGGRFDAINFDAIVKSSLTDIRKLEKLAYAVIGSSEYYDDPNDKIRTVANLEHCAITLAEYFLMNHTAFPIYIANKDDPTAEIGIEKSIDVVFTVANEFNMTQDVRVIGLLDVLYQNSEGKVTLGEYKTTSNMSDAWRNQFALRAQQSAYIGALHAYFDNISEDLILTGSTIPVRKTTVSVQHFTVERTHQHVLEFLQTAMFAIDLINQHKDNAHNAPMFTHSCNRYFNTCALFDLCTADKADQAIMLENMKVSDDMSPSEAKALMRNR